MNSYEDGGGGSLESHIGVVQEVSLYKPANFLQEALKKAGAVMSEVGLMFSDDIKPEPCANLVKAITKFKTTVDGSYRWSIGDALIAAEAKWGQGNHYEDVMESTGMAYEDVKNCKYVSNMIPYVDRVIGLSWSHHREACSMPTQESRTKVLFMALEKKWTVADTRIFVQSSKGFVSKKTDKVTAPPPVLPKQIAVVSWANVTDYVLNCNDENALYWLATNAISKITTFSNLAIISDATDTRSSELAKLKGFVTDDEG